MSPTVLLFLSMKTERYSMPLGRNVKEYLRLIDAYTHVQKFGEVCPANWEEGKEAMHADRKSTADYLAKH